MPRWHRLCRADDCPPGQNRFIRAGTSELALFHVSQTGEFIVTPNSCPHAGGNLSAGEVTGTVVRCPWHQWEFDLVTGACVHNEHVRVWRFPTRVEQDWVWVDLDGALPPCEPWIPNRI